MIFGITELSFYYRNEK